MNRAHSARPQRWVRIFGKTNYLGLENSFQAAFQGGYSPCEKWLWDDNRAAQTRAFLTWISEFLTGRFSMSVSLLRPKLALTPETSKHEKTLSEAPNTVGWSLATPPEPCDTDLMAHRWAFGL
jgi:hypothetical protein